MKIFGFIVLGLGWLMMLGGVTTGASFGGQSIANLHAMMIALSLIITGGLLIVAGSMPKGAASVDPLVAKVVAEREAEEAVAKPEISPEEATRRAMLANARKRHM